MGPRWSWQLSFAWLAWLTQHSVTDERRAHEAALRGVA